MTTERGHPLGTYYDNERHQRVYPGHDDWDEAAYRRVLEMTGVGELGRGEVHFRIQHGERYRQGAITEAIVNWIRGHHGTGVG